MSKRPFLPDRTFDETKVLTSEKLRQQIYDEGILVDSLIKINGDQYRRLDGTRPKYLLFCQGSLLRVPFKVFYNDDEFCRACERAQDSYCPKYPYGNCGFDDFYFMAYDLEAKTDITGIFLSHLNAEEEIKANKELVEDWNALSQSERWDLKIKSLEALI